MAGDHLSNTAIYSVVFAAQGWTAIVAFWNARACGLGWIDSKIVGGYPRFMIWCGLVVSALGFSQVILVLITAALKNINHIPPEAEHLILEFWYAATLIPAFGTGIFMMVNAWVRFSREQDTWSAMIAQGQSATVMKNINNLALAFSPPAYQPTTGGMISTSASSGSSSKDKDGWIVLAIIVVGISMLGGALITALVTLSYIDANQAAIKLLQRRTRKQIREDAMERVTQIY